MNQLSPTLTEQSKSGSFICWRTVLGGVLVAVFTYMLLAALGAGIGGLTASHIIEKGENASGLVNGAGFWMGASGIIAVFLGSYYGTRFSSITHKQVGACQAILIAAIFFYLVVNGTGMVVGSLSSIAGSLSGISAVSDADAAAKMVGDAGWMLFVTFGVGMVAAIIGGIEGTIGNVRRPFKKSPEVVQAKA